MTNEGKCSIIVVARQVKGRFAFYRHHTQSHNLCGQSAPCEDRTQRPAACLATGGTRKGRIALWEVRAMKDLINRILSYQQELIDYEAEIQRGVQSSLPLIDKTLNELRGLNSGKCPFCSATVYRIDRAMQAIESGLDKVFDLPDTWPGGGFVSELFWTIKQDEARYCEVETEWFCTECRTGKLPSAPGKESFRFHWDRQNLPSSKQAIASRVFEQFPLITEMALAGRAIHTWYVLYDDNWYVSLANNELFVKKWGLTPKESVKDNGPVPGYIYLMHCEGWYKIGKTTQEPEDRLAQIDTAIPFETTLIHTIRVDDCNAVEQHLHARFSDKRWKGEWFKLDESDIEYIKELGATE